MKSRRPSIIVCLLLAAVTVALYWPAHTFEFTTYDDPEYVAENVYVHRGLTVETVVWAFKAFYVSNWHPLTWLSHALDVQLFGLDAGKHHLVNVFFHCANAVLLFLLFHRMTGLRRAEVSETAAASKSQMGQSRAAASEAATATQAGAFWRCAFIAAFFAWHPLRVESVAWVAERKDVLSTFFGLISIWFYVRFVESRKGAEVQRGKGEKDLLFSSSPFLLFYILSLLFFTLSLMSKPMLVTLPFVLLLLDYWPLNRMVAADVRRLIWQERIRASLPRLLQLLREKLPFFVLVGISCVLTFLAQKQGGAVPNIEEVAIGKRLVNATLGYLGYLEKLFLPWPLAVFYPIPATIPWLRLGISLLCLSSITVIAMKFYRRRPYLLLGWLWFLGTLVPVIGIVQAGSQLLADRYSYISFIGLTVGIVWLVCDAKVLKARILGATAAAILVACIAGTRHQLAFWRNGVVLFEHAIAVTPENDFAFNNLGAALVKAGRFREAEAARRRALELRPSWFLYGNLASDLVRQKKFEEALPLYEKARQLNPKKPEILKNWGLTLLQAGYTQEGFEKLTAAVMEQPDDPEALFNLAYGLTKLNRNDEAIAAFQKVLTMKRDYPEPHLHLGFLQAQRGKIPEAIAHYESAIGLNPFYAEAHNNLANILLRQGKMEESLQHSLAALKTKPDFEPAHINAADVYLAKGDIANTIHHWRAAVRSRPDWPELCNNLAWLLATSPDSSLRNGSEAVELAERACKLTQPTPPDFLATLSAAYAEAGRFDDAVKTSEQAIAAARAAQQTELVAKLETRLQLFRSRKPFHE